MPSGVYKHIKGQGGRKGRSGVYPRTEEHRRILSETKLAKPTRYWLGKKRSEETIKKVSDALKGKPQPWNKGRKMTEEHKQKLIAINKGREPWNKGKKWLEFRGENNPNWGGGVTSQNKIDRERFRMTIQKEVFERDAYTCQICGQEGGSLQVDHIQSWKDFVEKRFDMNNCRTLCMSCHYFITFGRLMPADIKTWGHNFSEGGY